MTPLTSLTLPAKTAHLVVNLTALSIATELTGSLMLSGVFKMDIISESDKHLVTAGSNLASLKFMTFRSERQVASIFTFYMHLQRVF